MRLFVAVDLDEVVRREVGDLIHGMRVRARDGRSTRITWVVPERLHLTLHFLGEVEPEAAARLAERVAAPIDLPAFRVVFGGVGTFSARGRPNVIWLGVRKGREPLIALHSIVGQRLKAVGCELEDRRFSPHLTLARVKQTSARGLSAVLVAGQGTGPDRAGSWGLSPTVVSRVTLYESQLGRMGATHTVVATGLLRPERTWS
jgi:2'-5' RNA ligase